MPTSRPVPDVQSSHDAHALLLVPSEYVPPGPPLHGSQALLPLRPQPAVHCVGTHAEDAVLPAGDVMCALTSPSPEPAAPAHDVHVAPLPKRPASHWHTASRESVQVVGPTSRPVPDVQSSHGAHAAALVPAEYVLPASHATQALPLRP